MMDRSSFARSWLHFDHLVGRFFDKVSDVGVSPPIWLAVLVSTPSS
jgi:hypothetical protein